MAQTIDGVMKMTSSQLEKTGSKLGPMTQPYLPLALALAVLSVQMLVIQVYLSTDLATFC